MVKAGVATGMPGVGDAHSEVLVDQDLAGRYSPPKELRVLGEFTVSQGSRTIDIAPAGQRVLAMLALSDTGISRATLAGTLWPDKSQTRAAANLRCALWRLPEEIRAALDGNGVRLRLDSYWSVDIVEARRVTAELRGSYSHDPKIVDHFRSDLLPDWVEEWLLVERERYHQLRIHALELLADRQLKAGEPALAAETALLAICAEPLRESSMSVLLQSEIELDNRATAVEHYRRFATLLCNTLGVQPSSRLRAVVAPFLDDLDHN
jgi:DNA-binding SARP family transcriptional activator